MTDQDRRSHGARWSAAAAGLFAFAALGMPALATEVTVSGCPRPGVEAGCIVLSGANGTVYNVSAAEPKPEIGVAGTVVGTVSTDASVCMQGAVLKPARWSPTPGVACPAPKTP